jgi:6-methylsalicylate decarboxylase
MPAHDPVIDFHAHFVPDYYREAATAAGYGEPDGIPGFPPWSVDEALGMMDRNEIALAVTSASSPGVHFGNDAAARRLARRVNEFSAGMAEAAPLLDQAEIAAMMSTNGLPLLDRFGSQATRATAG